MTVKNKWTNMSKNKRNFIITELLLGVLLVIGIGFIAYNKLNEKPERIAVVMADVDESHSAAFKYGMKMAASEYGVDVVMISKENLMWNVSGVSDTGEKINLQSQRKVDIVLAIDDASVVDAAKEASDNNLQGALVYGIGNSTEAIYYLDSGWAEALITPDEFAAGYKSVVGLVDMLRGSRKYSVEEKPVSYQLLTRKNLFDEENKKLLYAISQ